MANKVLTVALAGNPNSGKTTVFNALTGSRQHVGNYPGVTVEKKEGRKTYKGYEIRFVDLPGTYSLTAHSVEELVARDFIITEQPDVVVDVIDSTNLERNLYLATQLLELEVPLVLALNMADVAKKQGLTFDNQKMGYFFDAEVVSTVGSRNKGIEQLLDAIIEKAEQQDRESSTDKLHYGDDIEKELNKIEPLVDKEQQLAQKYGTRWLSLKLLEQDEEMLDKEHNQKVLDAVSESVSHLERLYGDSCEVLIAERRYGFVSGVFEQCVTQSLEQRHQVSDMVDKVLLNRVLGLPIFLGMMYLVFKLTFFVGEPFMVIIENGFGWLAGFISGFWQAGSENILKSLIVDGLISGVGGVIVFLPNIMFLFLGIAILEDSGYMARAAFVMDRVMKKIGLHGRSFIPMLIGFGCTVPAIMGTRIIDDKKSRLTTILVLPLMSCGARFPIYALIIPAFFAPAMQGLMMWLIYLTGVVLAIILIFILRKSLLKGDSGVFLMELPPYRMPTLRGLFTHMWQRSWLYLKKAGTIILAISIIMWAITSYPKPDEDQLSSLSGEQRQTVEVKHSIAGRIGQTIEPVLSPMGFDYKIGTALIGAFAAKEVFVAQMGIVYSVGDAGPSSKTLRSKLRENYTSLQGFCIMLFCLISTPCMATVAVCRRETNSWGWAMFQFFGLTVLAYVITVTVYQIGVLVGG
jgi:ferrous iron transport protein B